jgi:hypothetical protein
MQNMTLSQHELSSVSVDGNGGEIKVAQAYAGLIKDPNETILLLSRCIFYKEAQTLRRCEGLRTR